MMDDDLATANAPAEGRWTFDEGVTEAFESMLERSIPNYKDMRRMVTEASSWLIDRAIISGRRNPGVVDLGASRGSAVAPLVDRWGARARFWMVETSEPMLDVLRERFAGMIDADVAHVQEWDLRNGLPVVAHQPYVILSVLTLQFVPIEYRQRLLAEAYLTQPSGGGLILVEKVLGESDDSNRLLVDLYHGLKRENGYTKEAIDRKRMALEGVLVPLTASINEAWLKAAGYETVETIWSWANFRAWLAVKR